MRWRRILVLVVLLAVLALGALDYLGSINCWAREGVEVGFRPWDDRFAYLKFGNDRTAEMDRWCLSSHPTVALANKIAVWLQDLEGH